MLGMWKDKHKWAAPVKGAADRCSVCGLTADECVEYMMLFCPGFTQRGVNSGVEGVLFSQAPLVLIRRG